MREFLEAKFLLALERFQLFPLSSYGIEIDGEDLYG